MFKSSWELLDRESYKCVAYRVHYLALADVFLCSLLDYYTLDILRCVQKKKTVLYYTE